MITRFDHATIVVDDLRAAVDFFALLGFAEEATSALAGEAFEAFLGVDGLDATHVVLAVPDLAPRFEIQLRQFHTPKAKHDPNAERLDKLGFNHICFAVTDIEEVVAHLRSHEIPVRGPLEGFLARKLYFVTGPGGITIELSAAS